jgi:hypothetical protein
MHDLQKCADGPIDGRYDVWSVVTSNSETKKRKEDKNKHWQITINQTK